MATRPRRIKVTPGSQLGKLLASVGDRPVLLEIDGGLYRLDPVVPEQQVKGLKPGYDPTAALDGINAGAGTWHDLDPEAVKAYVSQAREEGTRPAQRP